MKPDIDTSSEAYKRHVDELHRGRKELKKRNKKKWFKANLLTLISITLSILTLIVTLITLLVTL